MCEEVQDSCLCRFQGRENKFVHAQPKPTHPRFGTSRHLGSASPLWNSLLSLGHLEPRASPSTTVVPSCSHFSPKSLGFSYSHSHCWSELLLLLSMEIYLILTISSGFNREQYKHKVCLCRTQSSREDRYQTRFDLDLSVSRIDISLFPRNQLNLYSEFPVCQIIQKLSLSFSGLSHTAANKGPEVLPSTQVPQRP